MEDCLILNIFTKEINPTERFAVIFYIHGGSYVEGSGIYQDPSILLDEDVVLVTFNYRLGPFGFLSLDTPEYSGNMGLKDQLLALKWVNKSIHHFGGDPQRVTLYGHSAGGSSVNFHLLSPASRGIFQRAIVASGSALNKWAYNDVHNHTAIVLHMMESPSETLSNVIDWLLRIDANRLSEISLSQHFQQNSRLKEIDLIWAPVVEKEITEESFMTKSPREYYEQESSNIDTMFGYTSAVGNQIFLQTVNLHLISV